MLKSAIKDNFHFKWTPESTNVLVNIWTDCQVQHDLRYADLPSVVWDKISRIMGERGYLVSGKQCRTRMMEVLVCYREAKKANNGTGVEQYFKILERVMCGKNLDQDLVDVDTVDSTVNYDKTPVKDIKINVPKKVQQKVLKVHLPIPQQPIIQTSALSPTCIKCHECVNSDSPESNETIIAKPHRLPSPGRRLPVYMKNNNFETKSVRRSEPEHIMYLSEGEEAMREEYRPKFRMYSYPHPHDEVFYQNSVQNAQNHIIQENMQQNTQQNLVGSCRNHLPQQNEHSLNQQHFPNGGMDNSSFNPYECGCYEDLIKYLQNPVWKDFYKAFRKHSTRCPKRDAPRQTCVTRGVQVDLSSQNCSLDATQDLNDAFYQSDDDEASYPDVPLHQRLPLETLAHVQTRHDATVLTNNATCNESLLEESEVEAEVEKLHQKVSNLVKKNMPFRKAKGKPSQILLEAIKTQTETFSKVITAQTNMMAQVLDEDKGRHNRLEDKLDHLLSTFSPPQPQPSSSSSPEPVITSLHPPPKPGMAPPKLDLVPPKPCRVPCTIPSTNVELINQNPIQTKPGVISPIVTNSPNKKPGTIWSKFGPVSMSPFIKAQKRLGLDFVSKSNTCMQSSAERRIEGMHELYADELCKYTASEPLADQHFDEKKSNQWFEREMHADKNLRRTLFKQQEPMIPTIITYMTKVINAFLNAERRIYDHNPPYRGPWKLQMHAFNCAQKDHLLTGQGESYERMSELNAAARRAYLDCKPCDTSTPARLPLKNIDEVEVIRQKEERIIKQVAQSVMSNARWRDFALQNQQHNSIPCTATTAAQTVNQNAFNIEYKTTSTIHKNLEEELREFAKTYKMAQKERNEHNEAASDDRLQQIDSTRGQPKFPMGFTTDMLTTNDQKDTLPRQMKDADRLLGFNNDKQLTDCKNNRVHFMCADYPLSDDLQRQIFQKMYSAGLLSDLQLQYEKDDVEKKTIKEDSINEEEYLDTTTTMHATYVALKDSQTSDNMASAEIACSSKQSKNNVIHNCVIT